MEVKGSVELAPLTGLVDGIVDLTATGTHAGARTACVSARRSAMCTARLIANPVAHKLKADEIDALVERMRGAMRIARGRAGAASCARWRRRADVEATCARSSAEVRAGGDAAVLELTERFDRAELAPERAARATRASSRRALGVLEPAVLDGLRDRDRQRARGRGGAAARAGRGRAARRASSVEVAEVPVRRAGVYVPGGRARLSVHGGDVRGDRARGRGGRDRGVRAARARTARAHPVILAACALCGVTEVYRMGGAQAIAALAYGTESVPRRGRDRRARATARSRRPSARWSATVGIDGAGRARASWSWWPPTTPTPS